MQASVEAWARTEEEREDLMAQAMDLAQETVEREWRHIEPLAREAGQMVFRDISTWPASLRDVPLNPMPDPSLAEPEGLPPTRATARHLVAHGIVGAIVCNTPISVGFSGCRFGRTADDDAAIQGFMAGTAVDMLDAKTLGAHTHAGVDECECVDRVTGLILRHLGIEESDVAAAPGETLVERLRALGREVEYHDYFLARWTAVASLIDRAVESGFLDEEVVRLVRLGRIVLESVATAMAVGVEPGNPLDPTTSVQGRARADGITRAHTTSA